MAPLTRDNKSLNAKHAAILKDLLKQSENKLCGDCKRNDARWASTNIGVFMCIRCSGIHRGMGVHISRVKSVDLDTWSPEQIANIQRWGNRRANLYWEAHLKAGHQPPEHKIESFIRSKYESKRWALEGPVPDPDTIDAAGPSTAVAPPAQTAPDVRGAQAPARTSSRAATGIDLLSGPSPAPPLASPSTAAASAAASSTVTITGGGLFDLDFSTQAAPAHHPAPVKSNKADILSLFGAPPAQPAAPIVQASAAPSTALAGSFAGLNLAGAATSNPWNTSAVPAAPAPQQQQQQQQQQPASLYNAHDVWGAAPAAAGTDGFGGVTSMQGKTKQSDAFANLWD